MNSVEFKELQNEMGDLLYRYESFLKRCHVLDCRIINEYNDLIGEALRLRAENGMLANICGMLNEKKSLDEVDAQIQETKKKFEASTVNFNNKKQYAKVLVENLKDEESTKELEDRFKEFVKENHPAVKILITKMERMSYDQLRKLYLDNNLGGYESFLDMQKSFFRPCSIPENDYNKANAYYFDIRGKIIAEMEKKKTEYPLIFEGVFENDMTIASHRANYVIENNKLKAANKALHQDVIRIYGEDVNL